MLLQSHDNTRSKLTAIEAKSAKSGRQRALMQEVAVQSLAWNLEQELVAIRVDPNADESNALERCAFGPAHAGIGDSVRNWQRVHTERNSGQRERGGTAQRTAHAWRDQGKVSHVDGDCGVEEGAKSVIQDPTLKLAS